MPNDNDPFAQYYDDKEEELGVPDTSDPFAQYYDDKEEEEEKTIYGQVNQGLADVAMGAVEKVGEASQWLDKYTGAPIRKGIGSFLNNEDLSEIPGKMADQFGADPSTAPSGEDIMSKAGVPKEFKIPSFDMYAHGASGNIPETSVNPAAIGGALIEGSTDPLSYVPLGSMAKGGLKGAGKLSGGVGKLVGATRNKVFPGLSKVTAGIDPAKTKRYLDDPDAVLKAEARPDEQIKYMIEKEQYKQQTQPLEELTARLDETEESIKNLMDDKKFQLRDATTDSADSRNFMGALTIEKQKLGELSHSADIALENSGATFEKAQLLELLDNIGISRGRTGRTAPTGIVGEAEKAALDKLHATRTNIEEGLPDIIPATDLRHYLGEIRDDIDWNQKAGDFNTTLTRMRKKFSHGISEALKDSSPEYSAYMKKMSEMAEEVEQLNKYFGDLEGAQGSLTRIRKGGEGAVIPREIVQRYADKGRPDLQSSLSQFDKDLELSRNISRQPERTAGELFPSEMSEKYMLEDYLNQAKENVDPILGKPGTDTLQSKMNAMKAKPLDQGSIEFARALKKLSKGGGENLDFETMLRDKGVAEAFGKDATRGGRAAITGASIGASIGGNPGMAIGGAIGYTIDRTIGTILKKSMDATGSTKKILEGVASKLKDGGPFAGKYGPILEKAVNRGGNALVVAHHTMMNRDPEYRASFEENQ